MPLSEREREELAKKIEQQRKAMWEGQTTNERRTKKGEEIKETEGALETQSEHREVKQAPEYPQKREKAKQTPEPDSYVLKDGSVEEREEVEQPSGEQKQSEKEMLAEKIRQQRRAVWKGKPARKSRKRKSRNARSIRRVVSRQQGFELTEQSPVYEQEAEEESVERRSIIPSLKLALIVVISLIGAIAIGIAIGYIVASRDLIKI